MRHNDIATARQSELFVCSVDYDGCVSVFSAGDAAHNLFLHLHQILIEHPEANVVLMVGSARQSIISDLHHERVNKNGSCLIFFKDFLESFKLKHPDLADRISLDPFLLEDIFREKNPGHHFSIRVDSFSDELRAEYRDRGASFKNGIDIHWQDLFKRALIYAQLHYIGMKHQGKKIQFHFFDDRVCILDNLISLYGNKLELIPSNVSLRLFNYAAGHFNRNVSFDIGGVGFVDNDYSNNVKSFNVSGWLNSLRVAITKRVLSEPNLTLAKHLYRLSSDKDHFIFCLREKWGEYIFEFLDCTLSSHEKMVLVETWLPDMVASRDVARIQHCLRYVHPNVCVDYFIEALEKNDDVLSGAFLPAMLSVNLAEFSKNEITLILFSKKKYDWINNLYPSHDGCQSLVEWCHLVEKNDFKKSLLRYFLNVLFIRCKDMPIWIDLTRFAYHLSTLPGDALSEEACYALSVIVSRYARNSNGFVDRLWCSIISPLVSLELFEISELPEEVIQKYLHGCTENYDTFVQQVVVEKIQAQCVNLMPDRLLSAYRALQFMVLSISLSPESVFNRLHQAITYWKNSSSIIPGKTHLSLLVDEDKALQEVASNSKPRSFFSFFCKCSDKNTVFSHVEFVDSLPLVARKVALTNVRLVVPRYEF